MGRIRAFAAPEAGMDFFKRRVDAANTFRSWLPGWLGRLVSAGIVSDDYDVRRRQTFVNIALYAGAFNAIHHTIINANYHFQALINVNIYNVAVAIIFLSAHRLHRYGDNFAAAVLVFIVGVAHLYIVWQFGTDSDLHIYLTLAGVIFFMFGIQNWRWWLPFLITSLGSLTVALFVLRDMGPVLPGDTQIRKVLSAQGFYNALIINAIMIGYALWALRRAELELQFEHERSETLLTTIIPERIAERLKSAPDRRIADHYDCVTVMFVDLVGFTPIARDLTPNEVVGYLDGLFRHFDALIDRHGVEKIKTIGDAYMIVGGLQGDRHQGAVSIGRLALDMLEAIHRQPPLGSARLTLRAGIHCGPAIAGVIGDRRFTYDVWGDAVNVASRMESQGIPDRIQVSDAFVAESRNAFAFEERGELNVKGIGVMWTYLIDRELTVRPPVNADRN